MGAWKTAEPLMATTPYNNAPTSRAPASVPSPVPRPPDRVVPPMTTEAMASSSYPWPEFGWPEVSRVVRMSAPTAAPSPEMTKTSVLNRSTRVPDNRAALSSPPIAQMPRPQPVPPSATMPITDTWRTRLRMFTCEANTGAHNWPFLTRLRLVTCCHRLQASRLVRHGPTTVNTRHSASKISSVP